MNKVPGRPVERAGSVSSSGDEELLFHKMERERSKIPNILQCDYLPVFIVKDLRERLLPFGEGTDDMNNLERMRSDCWNPFGKQTEEDSNMWTDDTFFEDNLDFEGLFLLTQENLNYVGRYLRFAKNAIECLGVHRNKIGRHFAEEFEYPCLELLYLMDTRYKILSLSSYLMWLTDNFKVNYIKKQFLAFAFSAPAFSFETRERSNRILETFLQTIIISHYCNPCSTPALKRLKENCGEILKLITAKLTNIGNSSNNNATGLTMNHHILLSMLKDVDIPNSVRDRYFSEHINMLIRAGKKPFPSPMEIIQFQEKYADPVKLVQMDMFTQTVSQFISVLRTAEIVTLITTALTSADFNWEMLLYLIFVLYQEKQSSATPALKELSKSLIRNGLENKDENSVMNGFIIARHCSLIASEAFSRYEKWFTNIFESEVYSPAKEPEAFVFFTEVLTKWVPVEPSCFLHVHTTFWPFIPKGCRGEWSDYLALARIRISEYKEVEEAMEYEPNPNDPIQHEVGMAIKAFESRGKMPQSIVKMWIFSKQHYLTKFLPVLLRKPTNVVLTDSRLRLIELLKQDGKIPENMYAAYKAALGSK